jgi:hypothetical protein
VASSLQANVKNSTSRHELTIYLGPQQLWRLLIERGIEGSFTLTLDYSRPLRGVRHVVITSSDGGTATALVDGRATLPFVIGPNPRVVFPNGQRAPDVILPKGLSHAVEGLLKGVARESETCFMGAVTKLGLQDPTAPLAALASEPDFGHFSDTYGSLDCWACKGSCYTAAAACVYAASAGAACGPLAWLCIPAILVGCLIGETTCDKRCNNEICCPKECGGTNFEPACCEESETCLSTQTQLCCSSGKTRCGTGFGAQCCSAGEDCLPNADPGNKCCAPGHGCGSVCCSELQVCADPARSLCCLPANVCNGDCCDATEVCKNGACVPTQTNEPPTPEECATEIRRWTSPSELLGPA